MMFGYEEINLSLAYPFIYLLLALVLLALYSVYVYRYTIPQIENYKKIILVSLRVLALLALCLILFEPILNLTNKLTLEPENLVFIDNSRSMMIDDGTNREIRIKEITDDFANNLSEDNISLYEFGNKINEVNADSLNLVDFSEGSTNLQEIFNYVRNSERNIASVTIISDGVITACSNPYYDALNLGIPVYTIGIGDTTQRKDVELKKILHNDFIYAQTPTSIIANISNKGFSGEQVSASLYEDNKFISRRNVVLSNAGIQSISFDYNPESSGEKKLSVQLSSLDGEFTTANNKQIFYVNVLSNKIKVLLLASAPSSDLTFVKSALERDENIQINSIVQISSDNFIDKLNYNLIDSAEVLYLIGFPSEKTPADLTGRIIKKIKEDKTPYFMTLSSGLNANFLSRLVDDLPFTFSQNIPGERQVQPYILPEAAANPILQYQGKNVPEIWNNLPPVLQPNGIFSARIESKTLAQISINNNVINSPLIIASSFSRKRTITLLAKDIWRWKLQTAPKGLDVFDNFIVNTLRWLKANEEQKPVRINTTKKNFSQGERVEFYGEVFDESLNPLSDAEVTIDISSGSNRYELVMQNVGPGLYEGSILINETGDFNYSTEATAGGRTLVNDHGSFNIGEIDVEMIDPVMNYGLLNLLAKDTGGEFYFPDNYKSLFSILNDLKINSSKEKIVISEISLWSNTWMLVIAIFLFAAEWFIRKRNGML